MTMRLLFLLPILAAAGSIQFSLRSGRDSSLKVIYPGRDAVIEQCVKGGLEVRFRFEVRLCKRRSLWWSACKEPITETHFVRFDPITENYQVVFDRLGDKAPPITSNVSTLREALQELSTIQSMPLLNLAHGDHEFASSPKAYVSARVISHCKGEFNETVARISDFLTLGLLDVGMSDTGWSDSPLDDIKARP